MPTKDPGDAYLDRLRGWRNRKDFDHSLSFIKPQFKREVEKPYKQLLAMAQLWPQLVPAELLARTKLETISRGVLKVIVDSSGALYELDRLLREGLEQKLITQNKGPAFRRVQLRVGRLDDVEDVRTRERK